jgi:hypothetical protein
MKKIMLLFFLTTMVSLAKGDDKPILIEVDWLKSNFSESRIVLLQTSFLKFDYAVSILKVRDIFGLGG